ncbi:sensor histidine kinase [Nocardioides glacieisoli]|jgi:signal transduction histidine kinase|nr:ATP-binding protein [Nocardioides glacieisoli]
MNQPDIEAVFVDALQNIAEGVTDLVGFEVAAISIARDDHTLEMIAVAGSAEARDQLLGRRTPISDIEQELRDAEAWGDLRFVPHERMTIEADKLGWVPDLEPSDDPERWHPLDLLLAPIYDEHGKLRGLLSVDVPHDRRRPGLVMREQLQRYAHQTRRSVLTALERAQLAEQVQLADTARRIVREVSSELSIDRIIEICQPAVATGLGAVGMWLQTFDQDDSSADAVYGATEGEILVPEEFKVLGRGAAELLWATQEVAVVTEEQIPVIGGLVMDVDQAQRLRDFMDTTLEASTMLFVPIGAGQKCLGNLALTRRGPKAEWTVVEQNAALEIGRDLGRAMLNARTFEREHVLLAEVRVLLEEVQELARYKSRLIATIAHELKNPLTAILGHVEMAQAEPTATAASTRPMSAIQRAAVRMRSTIDDLLVLAEVADPDTVLNPAAVDLVKVIVDVLDLLRVNIDEQGLDVVLDLPTKAVYAWGEAGGLFRLCVNLVSNAVKYTPRGGVITISLSHTAQGAQLTVTDTGMGISAEDQERLFEEFFRSTNREAVAIPGTGLGLAIVHRIVERHRGHIRAESNLGSGSTFAVTLPSAP